MPRGKKASAWERCVSDLLDRNCQFRLCKRSRTPIIQIRQLKGGEVVDQFSSKVWRHDDDEHVEAAWAACIASDKLGRWQAAQQQVEAGAITWADLADMVLENLRARVRLYGWQLP